MRRIEPGLDGCRVQRHRPLEVRQRGRRIAQLHQHHAHSVVREAHPGIGADRGIESPARLFQPPQLLERVSEGRVRLRPLRLHANRAREPLCRDLVPAHAVGDDTSEMRDLHVVGVERFEPANDLVGRGEVPLVEERDGLFEVASHAMSRRNDCNAALQSRVADCR